MKNVNAVALLAALAGVVGIAVIASQAGPLNPPAGPVSSTYKTLSDVQPRIPIQSLPPNQGPPVAQYAITADGSYYLTASIFGASTEPCIYIASNVANVTIDLNGFTLDGHIGGAYAIFSDMAPGARLTVRNGSFVGWTAAAIEAGSQECQIDSLQLSGASTALDVGAGSIGHDCIIRTPQTGIIAGAGARLTDCTVIDPSNVAFSLGDGASAVRCSCHNGTGFTNTGITTGNNAQVIECNILGTSVGIDVVGAACRVERCKVGQNTIGIRAVVGNEIMDNTINAGVGGVGQGIVLTDGYNRVQRNHIAAFATGILIQGAPNVVTSNALNGVATGINTSGFSNPLVAPVVSTAAALATNPVANTQQ
jgi:hypothetical protein